MKRYFLPLALLTVAAVASAHSSSIGWKRAYGAATTAAKSSGKLIMIDFYTDWCEWCKKLDADTYPAPAVVQQSEKFVPIKLNAEKDPDGIRLAKKFGVNGYPTVLFIDGNENLVYKVVGYAPPKEFAESMSKASTIRHDRSKYKAELKADPKSFDGLVGMSGIDASTGDLKRALAKSVNAVPTGVTGAKRGKLLDAYNAVGDGYQNANQFDKAIAFFSKAIDPKFSTQTAYARISIAVCYLSAGKKR